LLELVVAEILKRTGSIKDFLRASFINRCCNACAKSPDVISAIVSHNSPCFIRFLCEHAQGNGPEMKLIIPPGAPIDNPVQSMRERFVTDCFYGKHVLGTHGSRVIIRMEAGPRPGKLYMNRPCGLMPQAFSSVAKPIPPMSKNPGANRLGQLVVLPPDNGPLGGYPVFFVKDYSRPFAKAHVGVKFTTPGTVRLHVSVFSNGEWCPHVSEPLVEPSAVTFQRSPYCVQAGPRLYMMYLVNLIAWFDVERQSFGAVSLLGHMETEVKGCLEYTAGPHPQGDLAIVHLDNGFLVRWVLIREGNAADWYEEASVDVAASFGHLVNNDISDALAVQPSD